MEKVVKVSVILPSLNVKRYIGECIESVRNQSLREIEIICVDAGSTDGTLELLKNYERKDSRIKVIISDRKSYGYQMNLGINAARGEFIGIVETDDFVPKEMYEELYLAAKKNTVDFVKADFYRFTGEGKELLRTQYRLAGDCSYYNRIIDIEKEPECFRFPLNTWSGIYSRNYLMKYNICHNETAGASFQDNGFWFQTFAYAKRAFFVDKSYYMNRRDNYESSVFSKKKTYCICDEYDFIKNILDSDKALLDRLKPAYSWAKFMAYKGNLDRISEDCEIDFLRRFSQDFQKMRRDGCLDLSMFRQEEKDVLLSIMEEPQQFHEHSLIFKKKYVQNKIRSYKDVIIYGAGAVGKNVWNELVYNSMPIKVHCFAVSKKQENPDTCQGVPVCEIQDLLDYREKSLIIIAVSLKYQSEIKDTLKGLGFVHTMDLEEYGGV